MTYWKETDDSGNIASLMSYEFTPVIGDQHISQISRSEYDALMEQIMADTADEPETDEISSREALDIITGVTA